VPAAPPDREERPDTPFLRWLTDEEAQDLLVSSQRRTFSRGDVVFREGDDGGEVMVLRKGRVKVSARRAGREVILSVLDPGSILGELSALDGAPRSATVAALEEAEIDVVDVEQFRHFLRSHPGVSTELLGVLAARLRHSSSRLLEFGATDTLTRLCATLSMLAERYGSEFDGRLTIEPALSQAEIASWCGMSREALVKGLQQLRRLGWLTVEDRAIVLIDAESVRRRARFRP
jgi:CRP-like cAMP-binding protein